MSVIIRSFESINHLKMLQAPSMEGLSKTQSHPLFFKPLPQCRNTTKHTLLNSNQVWKSSVGRLPLCELQVNLLNHVMGIYTAHCLDSILRFFFFCHPFLSRFHRLTENICFSFPAAFPSRGSRPPRHGYHTGQEWRGQYPLCSHQCLCLT